MDLLEKALKYREKETKPLPPPRPPKKLKRPLTKPKEGLLEIPKDLDKWFIDLALSSEFKRLIYRIWKGKVHRGKSEELNQELGDEISVRFGNVMEEMKENFKNGFKKPSEIRG